MEGLVLFTGNCEKAIQRPAKMCLPLNLSPRAAWRALHLFRFPVLFAPPPSFLPSCTSCVHPESLMKMHCVHYSGTVKPFNHQRREVSWLSSECVSVQSLTCFCERPPNQKKKCSRVSLRALAFDERISED